MEPDEGGGPEVNLPREPNPPLIVIGSNCENETTSSPNMDIPVSEEQTGRADTIQALVFDGSGNQEANVKLCGWLHVLSTRAGIIKTNRQRFCVFGDDSCKLYLYRNPHDVLPLDEIDIARASFHFDASNLGKPGIFEIRSANKEHVFDASDRHTMMYWLQELQTRRRNFCLQRNSLSRERLGEWKIKRPNYRSGLTSNKDETSGGQQAIQSDLPFVQVPNSLPLPTSEDGALRKSSWSSIPSPSQSHDDLVVIEPGDVGKIPPQVQKNPPKPKGGIMSGLRNKVLKKSPSEPESYSEIPVECTKCKELRSQLRMVKEEYKVTEEELQANREIVILLQKELDKTKADLESRKTTTSLDSEGYLELLSKRDKHVIELEYCLTSVKKEKELTFQQFRSKEGEIKTMKDQLNMYEDMLKAKDEIIVKLTDSLTEMEKKSQTGSNGVDNSAPLLDLSESPSLQAAILNKNAKEVIQLKDSCQAYELQNQFLNREILELQELRKHEESKMKTLMINYAQMEARFYQTRSKYLVLLKESQPQRGGGEPQELVSQLLGDALEETEDVNNRDFIFTTSNQEYDRYGFIKRGFGMEEDEEDLDPLVAKATKLEKQSTELTNRIRESDELTSHLVKWENFMAGQTGKCLQRSPELKALIRSGVPHEYRTQIWKGCVNFYVGPTKDKLGPYYYRDLQQKEGNQTDPALKQIELDLLRTLPNNKHYESADSEGVTKLRRVLASYSIHNPLVGYCQGLNRLAAIALLFLSEEESFWLLVAIVEYLMPVDYYSKTLIAAQADQRVLKDLIQEKLPRIWSHVEQSNVDLSLFTFNWFLTIFVDNIPPETFLRVWDSYLYEGSKVLFRFAVASFKEAEEDLLAASSALAINHYMRGMGEKLTNIRKISNLAFNWINPFPMRSISSKRQYYVLQLKGELAELDKLRANLQTSRKNSENKDYCSDDDLDS